MEPNSSDAVGLPQNHLIVNTAESADLLERTCKDYSNYAKVYVAEDRRGVENTIDDMLTRLDELMASLSMIRSDGVLCLGQTLPKIYENQKEMDQLFEKVDKLEAFVSVVKNCVDKMEQKVEEAEKNLATGNSITKVLNPLGLFSKKVENNENKVIPQYIHPEIFKTSDYFPAAAESKLEGVLKIEEITNTLEI